MTIRDKVCFVANRPWDEGCTQAAMAMVDWHGDTLALPPFELEELPK